MKRMILIIVLICLCSLNIQTQGHTLSQEKSKAQEDSTSSILGGLYGTYPLLNTSELEELAEKTKQNRENLLQLEAEKTRRLDSLNVLLDSDTVAIRKHSTFLGGRFTYPKLTDQEKKGLEIRKKIAEEQKEIAALEEETAKLKVKQKEMEALKKKHDQYLEKKILWGFIVWEVKRKGKR